MKYLLLIVLLMGCVSTFASVSESSVPEPATPEPSTPKTLAEYELSIDYSCLTDSDCEIKDVHNCCGYYPMCVNTDTIVDPGLVRELCGGEGMASICGWRDIDACRCSEGRCEGYLA